MASSMGLLQWLNFWGLDHFRMGTDMKTKGNDSRVSHLLQDSRRDTFALTGSSVRRSFLESV
jgi:hypothetical protein